MWVLADFKKTPLKNPRADVNGDGAVDKRDILLVARHLGESTTPAVPIGGALLARLTPERIQQSLEMLRAHNDGSLALQRGIASLEHLLGLRIPNREGALSELPESVQPGDWIPYHLAAPADVTLTIYSADGKRVRTLALGPQLAGLYESKSRAAYWDGRNGLGERVVK